MKYRCLPIGLCSWNFRIMHDQAIVARNRRNRMTEQGSIEIGIKRLGVAKHGVMNGKWSVQDGDATIATAVKSFTRRFELTSHDESYELKARAMSRCFDLKRKRDGVTVAFIEPDHLFTRRSSIQTMESIPIELVAFAFWLAVLCWRRAASSD